MAGESLSTRVEGAFRRDQPQSNLCGPETHRTPGRASEHETNNHVPHADSGNRYQGLPVIITDENRGDFSDPEIGAICDAKDLLWLKPLPKGGGHLARYLESGDPDPGPGRMYRRADLTKPDKVDVHLSRQGQVGNCYWIAAFNAFAQHQPERCLAALRQEGDKIIGELGERTYVTNATLPYTEDTGKPYGATSADGTTMASYYEKLFGAAVLGSYPALRSGWPAGVLNFFFQGKYSTPHPYQEVQEFSDEELHSLLKSGYPIIVGFGGCSGEGVRGLRSKLGIIDYHAQNLDTYADGSLQLSTHGGTDTHHH